MNLQILKNLKDKKVLVTGHTGFKGAYLMLILKYLGAKIYGYALKEEKDSLYDILKLSRELEAEEVADIRDIDKLTSFYNKVKPDYVIHMAAQPLVLKSYDEPKYTYETNVMGTVNLLEAIRTIDNPDLKSFVNVTTDKVYENNDSDIAFTEDMKLCGFDPYANSKSCSDIITYSYKHSFFDKKPFSVNICRAGNVIGGGDIAENRILPDLYRAAVLGKKALIRNEESTRPYQYVIEPLISYLYIMLRSEDKKHEGAYNIGPDKDDIVNNKKIAELFYKYWNEDLKEIDNGEKKETKHEAKFLRLDNSKLKNVLGIERLYTVDEAVKNTVEIYKAILEKKDIEEKILKHIENIFS